MSAMHITVREARVSELDAAGALTAAVYRDDELAEPSYLPRLADAAARHRAAGTTQLVAVDPAAGDALVGAVVYVLADTEYADLATGREAEIRMLATVTAARGRGVGEALVRACVDLALAHQRTRLVLSTKPIMTTAHRLYERVGFVRTPERDWEFAPGKALLTFALPLE
jgi:ribosomal protein S18 acetylase RimI-like enzyme